MENRYKEIGGHYDDVVCDVSDNPMSSDIRLLLRYIEDLHRDMIERAANEAVRAAFAALAGEGSRSIH